MVREESKGFPLRETLGFIVSSRAIGSSDRKDGSVEYVCMSVLACLRSTQMQWMSLISPMLVLLAAMPCSNEVSYKVMTWLHGNTLGDFGV